MPTTRKPEDYLRLAEHWFAKAHRLPEGKMREGYLKIAAGYEKLASALGALERNPVVGPPWETRPQSGDTSCQKHPPESAGPAAPASTET